MYGIRYIPMNNDTKLNLNDLVFNNEARIIAQITSVTSPMIAVVPNSLAYPLKKSNI